MSVLAVAVLLVASMTAVGTAVTIADFRALAGRRLVLGCAVAVNVVLVPGLAVRRRDPGRAVRVHRVARRVADVLLAGLVGYFLVTAGGHLPALGWPPVAVAATLVVVCLAVAAVTRLGRPEVRRAVGMTSAVRNLSLALFVATPAGAGPVVALLAYGLVMYAVSVPAAVWLGRARMG